MVQWFTAVAALSEALDSVPRFPVAKEPFATPVPGDSPAPLWPLWALQHVIHTYIQAKHTHIK